VEAERVEAVAQEVVAKCRPTIRATIGDRTSLQYDRADEMATAIHAAVREALTDLTVAPDERYPEHAKLHAVKEQSQLIGAFLDLGRWTLCELREFPDESRPLFVSVNIQDALAEYFGIDRSKLDDEKDQMLADLREAREAHRGA
jgi:hypothetical protein